jgi:RNA-binding protein YlmH
LGALIALGIDRSAMGDILQFPFGAVVFVLPSIADFLLENPSPLQRVGADKVRICTCNQPPATREVISEFQRTFEPFSDVVASPRLDCAVSAFVRTSREKAKAMILAEQVYLNHRAVIRPDATVSAGDVLSIRGTGKFCIVSMKLTQKERVRIEAKRYL